MNKYINLLIETKKGLMKITKEPIYYTALEYIAKGIYFSINDKAKEKDFVEFCKNEYKIELR